MAVNLNLPPWFDMNTIPPVSPDNQELNEFHHDDQMGGQQQNGGNGDDLNLQHQVQEAGNAIQIQNNQIIAQQQHGDNNHNQQLQLQQANHQNQQGLVVNNVHPSDEELMNILHQKITGGQVQQLHQGLTVDTDFHNQTPEVLWHQFRNGEGYAYILSPRYRSTRSQEKARRIVIAPNGDRLGTWERNDTTRTIGNNVNMQRFGMVFINGQGIKTNYMVKEFVIANMANGEGNILHNWALYKLYRN